ncbi:sigma-54-dependent Fis family transcriptional regulator [Roseateles sp. SL47]|uniref:sigma-54-dependent Fis family transcriptional regulator n=1 Tax=Roseateles sp. SL47 TaxID=2995138 RepID=UPI00226F6DD5|nr:sigma-54-dependent Fis family transcriptional regulator [Roseateles sp. SL47]WAC73685.1 sigma-54-dependent Fis family transcriptional regulator [Roseateles sp. SL47]
MSKISTAAVAPSRLRAARRELLETGELRLTLPDPGLGRSWLRSHAAGLSPVGRPPGAPHASSAQLRRALERQHELVAHARPVMQDLFAQTRDSDGMVILSDGQGLLLQALGDGRFVDRAQRVALRPGAIWDERWRGTNAIGTALVERRPVAVMGSEHYLERNGFLSCTAAPIRDPQGRVLGVLDISGDQRGFHRHTLALVRMAARSVEHRLFDTRHADSLRLQLHPQREGLGTAGEGLLAVSEDGWIIGGNETALGWLGAEAVRSLRLESVLPMDWQSVLAWACGEDSPPQPLRRDGEPSVLWMKVAVPPAWQRRGVALREAVGEADRGGSARTVSARERGAVEVPAMTARDRSGDAAAQGCAGVGADHTGTGDRSGDGIRAGTEAITGTGTQMGTRLTHPAMAAPAANQTATPATAVAPALPVASPSDVRPAPLAALDLGDPAVHQVLRRLHKVLDKPIALLLQGESGVGKDVLARAVHDSGSRRMAPYVAVNCAALPEGLMEAELFGYRAGAFTGAAREGAPGRLRQAHGGTLFLDEIGDMPLTMQARLLRVLQDRQVQPLGGGATVTVDVQLICASHRPLRQLVEAGHFREDLYYRINGLAVTLPPLRARSDLAPLIERLLDGLSPERRLTVSPALMAEFARYAWPGNIRQLEQALRVAVAMLEATEPVIQTEHLPEDLQAALADSCEAESGLAWARGHRAAGKVARSEQPDDRPSPEGAALRKHAQHHARQVLVDCGGNVSEAARRLGIGRNTLYRMLR